MYICVLIDLREIAQLGVDCKTDGAIQGVFKRMGYSHSHTHNSDALLVGVRIDVAGRDFVAVSGSYIICVSKYY